MIGIKKRAPEKPKATLNTTLGTRPLHWTYTGRRYRFFGVRMWHAWVTLATGEKPLGIAMEFMPPRTGVLVHVKLDPTATWAQD